MRYPDIGHHLPLLPLSDQSYRNLFENAVIGIFQTTLEGKIIRANKSFARFFGYSSPEEIIGTVTNVGAQLYVDPELRVEIVKQLKEKKEVKDSEVAFWHKSGQEIYGKLSVRAVCREGDLSYIEGFLEDITERKKAEEERDRLETQLARMQKMEAVGTLAAGIAHNFNNILTAILGNLSLGLLQCEEDTQIYQTLLQAEEAALRARSLGQQLLTFAKGGVPNKQTIFLTDLIKQSGTFASTGTSGRCEFSFPDHLWPVEADPDQLNQVIHNLVLNACQAMPGGGIIKVAAVNITLTADCELPLAGGHYIKVDIQDQGIGISKEKIKKIFDPYFTTKKNGTGLGLATVHSIIRRHGGVITAESGSGNGATFTFYLPASDKMTAHLQHEKKEPYKGSGKKILIMDDEEMVREIIGTMAAHLGYESESAADGVEAIELYQRARESHHPFDAVIMDLTIPNGMGGKETIEKLLEIDPQIKAIVSSGYCDDPVMGHYKDYGFSGAIKKPYRIATFSKVLSDCLKR